MEKIVYVLGAGFSAPLGLPIMSNFIEKSKDMYFSSPERYNNFEYIYSLIRDIANLKNFINSDLHNIEEILSILEMGLLVGDNNKDLEQYKDFLKDVIQYYTPKINLNNNPKTNLNDSLLNAFGNNDPVKYYGWFIANLFQTKLFKKIDNEFPDDIYNYSDLGDTLKKIDYGIITLNYDLVVENIVDFLNSNYKLVGNIGYTLTNEIFNNNVEYNKINIAKLHGCMTTEIIAPTWNKSSSSNSVIQKAWKLAYQMLVDANQIRFIGYSLPVSDSYIKYLLSIAFKNSKHLKKIDVITVDGDNKTRERYEKLFSFPKFRFKNAYFEDFLKKTYDPVPFESMTKTEITPLGQFRISQMNLTNTEIETAHNKFMNE